jgi:molybdopterin-guanine dinucleotide biosynthesis protein A
MTQPLDVVVLAGGQSSRLGGTDKPGVDIGGTAILDRILDRVPTTHPGNVIVVGPHRRTDRPVRWCRESPPGGGPVAAIAAGLSVAMENLVAIVGGDMPFVGAAVAILLEDILATPTADAVLLADDQGQPQSLAGVYRRAVLLDRLAAIGDPAGKSIRDLLAGLALNTLHGHEELVIDCDTWTDVRRARVLVDQAALTDQAVRTTLPT